MASKTKEESQQKKRDPFAYFGGLGDGDDDDASSESDSEVEKTENKKLSFISKSATGDVQEKLPSAEDVLFVTKQPEFLKQNKEKDVDWEKLAKDDTKEEDQPIDYSTNAIPPPKTYDPVSEPIKPSLGDNSEEHNGKGSKRSSNEDTEAESPKKSRTDDS